MIALAAVAWGCLAVSAGSDRILAGDLASAFPALENIAADTPIALAPAPGVQRVFHAAELRRLAARFNLPEAPTADICVERPAASLDPARLLAAMQKTLPQAKVEILEFSRQAAPAGEIEFPAGGLRTGLNGSLWAGYVRYAGNRRFAIWARVKASVAVERVVAVEDLRAGRAIAASQLKVETREEFPGAAPLACSIEAVVGKSPRLAVRAGTAIRADLLDQPKEVVRGETVEVEVRNGGARLDLEAQAEGSGALGETIPVRNPTSHKRFLARVEGKGRVSVDASANKVNP